MKNKHIENIGKGIFATLFGAGNICFFGYLISENQDFAFLGFMLLYVGTAISLLALIGLLSYSAIEPEKCYSVRKACYYILANIPIAFLYAFIGLELLKL